MKPRRKTWEPATLSERLEAAMTADRDERKFTLDPRRIAEFSAAASEVAERDDRCADTREPCPDAAHHVTTVYFDSYELGFYRDQERSVRLRAKEYYSLPANTPITRVARPTARVSPMLWLELKTRDGTRTRKRRVQVPREDAAVLLGGRGRLAADGLRDYALTRGAESREALEAMADALGTIGDRAYPQCVINYRRRAWRSRDESTRLTLDDAVSVFPVPKDLWLSHRCVLREDLGRPLAEVDHAIVEVKNRGEVPDSIEQLLADFGVVSARFSKFRAGMATVNDPNASIIGTILSS